jgi:hypothetical protein
MGKLYQLVIENIYSQDRYDITSFGDEAQAVHKHVLYNVISKNERIVKIYFKGIEIFHDSVGFIPKK